MMCDIAYSLMIQYLSSITPLGYIAIGLVVLTAVLIFRIYFDDLSDFLECLRLGMQPDLISVVRGEWTESHWAGTKLMLWVMPSILSGYVAYSEFPKWWPGVFH